MEGDLADLPGIVRLARKYRARTYVDEAHGIGVLGAHGAGAAEHLGVLEDVDIVMGTFSKSLASVGGFIAGPKAVVDYLKHTARPFVFSASLPAASVAAVGAALEVMRQEPERQRRLEQVAGQLRRELTSRGFSVLDGITPIVPVVIQNEEDLCHLCKGLLEEGIYINPVLRPAAAHNLLRISCTAAHTDAQVERLVDTIERVAKRLHITVSRSRLKAGGPTCAIIESYGKSNIRGGVFLGCGSYLSQHQGRVIHGRRLLGRTPSQRDLQRRLLGKDRPRGSRRCRIRPSPGLL